MKKVILLPLFAVAFLVSYGWAQFCNCGTCVGSTPDGYGCSDGGCYYKEGFDEGASVCNTYCPEVATCPAGTIPPKVVEEGGYPTGEILYCRWEASCWPIAAGGEAACEADGYIYRNVPSSGQGAGKQCEGGTWTGRGKGDPNQAGARGYCNWGDCVFDPANDYSCLSGGCFEIMDATQEADCNSKLASKSQCPMSSLPKADQTSIKLGSTSAGLTVLSQSGSLLISSLKEATVSLFDMGGKQVLSQKVPAGYNTLSLNGQKLGVYYAVVSSGSSKQTVKVVLK